jgi:hypothetical protein
MNTSTPKRLTTPAATNTDGPNNLTLDTYLRDKSDADELAQRLN